MRREARRSRLGEGAHLALRLDDHQVHVERQDRRPPDGADHDRSHRNLRHEPAIHDIDVDHRRPGPLGGAHLFGQPAEVGGQDRRSDPHVPGGVRGQGRIS